MVINYVLEKRIRHRTVDYMPSRPLRDVGSWMRVLIAIDMTAIQVLNIELECT